MSFRAGYLFPSLFFIIWWLYSFSRNDYESCAYLSLFVISSLPIALIFLLLDKTGTQLFIFQLVLDLVVFAGFLFVFRTLGRGLEWWEYLGAVLLYETIIFSIKVDRLFK